MVPQSRIPSSACRYTPWRCGTAVGRRSRSTARPAGATPTRRSGSLDHSQGRDDAAPPAGGHHLFGGTAQAAGSASPVRLRSAERAPDFGPPWTAEDRKALETRWPAAAFSSVHRRRRPTSRSSSFTIGAHAIASLPEAWPWAERYGAGPRVRLADVVDDQPGTSWSGNHQLDQLLGDTGL